MTKNNGSVEVHSEQKLDSGRMHPVLTMLMGCSIGFIAASVLYSPYLPPWVPGILLKSPILFYGLFILLTGSAGYIWGLTDSPGDEARNQAKKIPINTIFTFMFIGFLFSVVVFSKDMPSWVPILFMEYPAIFYVLLTVIGGVVGYFWAVTENRETTD